MSTLNLILLVFAFCLVAIEAWRTKHLGWSGLAFWILAQLLGGIWLTTHH